MSTLVSDNVSVVLPDGIAEEVVKVDTDSDGTDQVAVSAPVAELDFDLTGDTEFSGSAISKSEITVKADQNESTKVTVDSNFKQNTINNDGSGSLEVSINQSNFRKSTIDAGDKKRDDLIAFKGSSTVIKSDVALGKGNDTITFSKATKFKGKTTVDLGKGGKDSIVLKANSIKKGKLVITNFTKKDTITVGKETFTFKDFKNGAEIPGIKIKFA